MRRALVYIRKLTRWKSLISFGVFYTTFVALSTLRMDYWHGHETLTWLTNAHEETHLSSMAEAEHMTQIAAYLDGSLAPVSCRLLQPMCSA